MTSLSAIGWIAVWTHRGQIMNGSRSVSERRISNETLPAPSTTAARSSTTATSPDAERGADLLPAGEMLGLRIVAEAAEVHDAPDTGRGGGPPEALGEPAITVAEVADAEGVDEVVRDVAAVERGAELGFVGHVDGTRFASGEIAAVARERDHVVTGRDQLGRERSPDKATPSRDRDAHPSSLSQPVPPEPQCRERCGGAASKASKTLARTERPRATNDQVKGCEMERWRYKSLPIGCDRVVSSARERSPTSSIRRRRRGLCRIGRQRRNRSRDGVDTGARPGRIVRPGA